MQHPPCGPGNCLALKYFFRRSPGVCTGGAPHPAPALTALCSAELDANVEQGLAVGLFVCDLEGRLDRGCKTGGGGGRAHLGTRPQDVSSFKLKGEGRPPCLKINK
nr:LOW QUALITY PROTEIN: N-cym protein-like [Neomonachus schauinslandi]